VTNAASLTDAYRPKSELVINAETAREMTDCILEAINSSIQAYISALTGRLCPSISSHD